MRVAVTGSDGFTGRFVWDALRARGVEAVSLRADLTNAAEVTAAVENTRFDRIIHLAAIAFIGVASWKDFYHVNQLGTFHLLEAIATIRPGARVLIASSAQVYGPGAQGLIAEDTPPNPANHYAISKLAMERGAALWRDRLDLTLARPFNYTGVGQANDYLLPKIVEHFRRRADVIELGNTWVRRDFGDVRAVADAYVGLVLADEAPSVVNIATGRAWSINEILTMLTSISGHSLAVRVNKAFVRPNDVPVLAGDVSRLRTVLPDWRPTNLSDTLRWMYDA